ncbi:transcriptional regulator, Fur family [Bartonella clarridgeiae 73]|uniref:Transcriptional regulator, Fur family n=1 Tax=Bartonella clarridgeiae (strain CCUG 45776 / CIP 104772 / 73) TaxID=696125 RepID=E6YIX3_BARC7|nr:Fur family transcriptional regulator [Bartonella clarridgeiae]WCR54624.1 MAG: Zinc uptake regulation protein Zur [Bartonella clarridgeiae]CBI76811.1 transcriptional regulator, Fur family [Bartonella clarridgeiae 73]
MLSKLTRNQALVLNVLKNEEKPLTAYAILDRLREEGFRAPLQVYRALEGLVQLKHIHRLESVNAFMVCSHPENCHHELTIFTICDKCGQVNEIQKQAIAYDIKKVAEKIGFQAHKSTVEIKGTCKKCAIK